MIARYLVDKSALARIRAPEVGQRLVPLIEAGEVATCALVEFEVLYSARSHSDLVRTAERRALAYEWVETTDATLRRALDVQRALALTGHHRVAIGDLIIAATAELAGLTVIHYDRDFDLIAAATAQRCEWVVPRGTVD